MGKYAEVLAFFFFFLSLTLLDLVMYYSWSHRHSLVPLFISIALTIVVGIITGMAVYEVFKHRNDKESW
jgi:membrane-bound metal-dependent hydrolase YbcI (DUF457 family)